MSARPSAAVEKALKAWKRAGGSIYKIAARHKIAPSSLYRAIKNSA